MSLTARPGAVSAPALAGLGARLGLAVAGVALVTGAMALALWLFGGTAPPPRSPFGMGMREAAPAASGLGGIVLSIQSGFYRSLQSAVSVLKESGSALWSLLALGFAYGVFHAAGPGHGKAVISAYLVANKRALAKGFGLSLAAALLQAVVAIALVSIASILLKATAATMSRVAADVELVSFAAVATLGALMTWRKAGKMQGVAILARDPLAGRQATECDHVHLPPPEAIDRISHPREWAGVVLAAGIRPCTGAIIVLVFALSQGLFPAGIAAVVAMAFGTALTTGLIGAIAVFAKGFALHIAGGRGAAGAVAIAGIELVAAAFVLVLGVSLLAGLVSAGVG